MSVITPEEIMEIFIDTPQYRHKIGRELAERIAAVVEERWQEGLQKYATSLLETAKQVVKDDQT